MFGFLKRFSMVGGGNGNAAVEAEARTVLGGARLFPRASDPDDGPRVVVWLGPRQNFKARLSAGWLPRVKVWAYVQGGQKVRGITQTLLVQITKVQMLDPQGQVVLEQKAGG